MGRVLVVFVLLLVAFNVQAYPLWHADEWDYERNLDLVNENLYDGFDSDDAWDFSSYNCVGLNGYSGIARRNPYDRFEPISERSSKRVLGKLRRADYNKLARRNPFDELDVDDADSFSDMGCWTLRDYNDFASIHAYDRWRPATLSDPESFEDVVRNVGVKRVHFFDYRDLYDLR